MLDRLGGYSAALLLLCGCLPDWDVYDPRIVDLEQTQATCGRINTLSDGFDGTELSPEWDTPYGCLRDADNDNQVFPPTNSEYPISYNGEGSQCYFSTRHHYDLFNGFVAAEVIQVASGGSSALRIEDQSSFGNGVGIDITHESGQLHAFADFGPRDESDILQPFASIAYDAAQHRFWRFRDDAGTLYWEAGDGTNFTVIHSMPTVSAFTVDFVRVGMRVTGSDMRLGSMIGGPGTGGWCPARSLLDSFGDGQRSRHWRYLPCGDGCFVTENENLVFTMPAGDEQPISQSYDTNRAFDLRESFVAVQVPVGPSGPGTASLRALSGDGDDSLAFNVAVNLSGALELTLTQRVDDADTERAKIPYDANTQFWRLRETGGTVFWETSPDGLEWETRANASPTPAYVGAVTLQLGGATLGLGGSAAVVQFDRLNGAP